MTTPSIGGMSAEGSNAFDVTFIWYADSAFSTEMQIAEKNFSHIPNICCVKQTDYLIGFVFFLLHVVLCL